MKEEDTSVNDQIDLELLIDYVEGAATATTYKRVDQYLAENEDERLVVEGIRTYYQQYGMDRQAMLAYLHVSKNESLTAFKESTVKESTVRHRTMPQWIGWAAAVLLVFMGMVALLFTANNTNDSKVITYLSDPYPVTVFLSDQKVETWVEAYQSGDFQQAARLLDNMLQQQDENSGQHAAQLVYYAGLSHLYQQPPQPAKAINYLSQVDEGPFVQQAHWYLALAHVMNEQPEEAQPLLKRIIDTQAYQNEKAAELLADISEE